jgi:hypothetical protein
VRAECLDWLLITGRGHLEQVLRTYVEHDNAYRPHRALGLESPDAPTGPIVISDNQRRVLRRDRLNGLLREYHRGLTLPSRVQCQPAAHGARTSLRTLQAIYPLTGPEALSMADVAEKLSAATGKRIEYVNVAPEEATSAQLATGMLRYTADALAELFAERRKGKEAQVSPVVQTILRRRATSFDEFAERHAAVFRGEQPAPKV